MTKLTDFQLQAVPGKTFTILQLTDMQLIDAAQQRRPDRLGGDEPVLWKTENMDSIAFAHIRKTMDTVKPDLIVITGDLIYGEFDDSGASHKKFCDCMSSFGIPWAPVFGNHDNETAMGVDWQCDLYARAENCLFARGNLTGNSNYTIGIYEGDTLVRVLYMLDSNTCYGGTDPALYRHQAFGEDQIAWVADTAEQIRNTLGHKVPGFFCCHIPTADFHDALIAAGYVTAEELKEVCTFRLTGKPAAGEPVDIEKVVTPAHPGDCGYMNERIGGIGQRLHPMFTEAGIDGFFCGHYHKVTMSVQYGSVRYTMGVKCGTYDYHRKGMLGGTRITVPADRNGFAVEHIYQGETVV